MRRVLALRVVVILTSDVVMVSSALSYHAVVVKVQDLTLTVQIYSPLCARNIFFFSEFFQHGVSELYVKYFMCPIMKHKQIISN